MNYLKIVFFVCFLGMYTALNAQTIPSVKEETYVKESSDTFEGKYSEYKIKFSDGTSGYIYYWNECSKYGIRGSVERRLYKNKDMAIKALYIYKSTSGDYSQDGIVECDD